MHESKRFKSAATVQELREGLGQPAHLRHQITHEGHQYILYKRSKGTRLLIQLKRKAKSEGEQLGDWPHFKIQNKDPFSRISQVLGLSAKHDSSDQNFDERFHFSHAPHLQQVIQQQQKDSAFRAAVSEIFSLKPMAIVFDSHTVKMTISWHQEISVEQLQQCMDSLRHLGDSIKYLPSHTIPATISSTYFIIIVWVVITILSLFCFIEVTSNWPIMTEAASFWAIAFLGHGRLTFLLLLGGAILCSYLISRMLQTGLFPFAFSCLCAVASSSMIAGSVVIIENCKGDTSRAKATYIALSKRISKTRGKEIQRYIRLVKNPKKPTASYPADEYTIRPIMSSVDGVSVEEKHWNTIKVCGQRNGHNSRDSKLYCKAPGTAYEITYGEGKLGIPWFRSYRRVPE